MSPLKAEGTRTRFTWLFTVPLVYLSGLHSGSRLVCISAQMPALQLPERQSAGLLQVWPSSQAVQLPPQSTSVSLPSRSPLLQASHSSMTPLQLLSTPSRSQFSTAAGLICLLVSLQSVPGVTEQPVGTHALVEHVPLAAA